MKEISHLADFEATVGHARSMGVYPRHVLLYLRSETVGSGEAGSFVASNSLPVALPAEILAPAAGSPSGCAVQPGFVPQSDCSLTKSTCERSLSGKDLPTPCRAGNAWRQFVKRVAASSSEEAVRLHKEMLDAGVAADVYSFSAVMTACQRNNDCNQVIRVFHEMKARGLAPDLLAYNTVIMAYANKGMSERVFDLFHEMKAADVSPDARTYTFVIAACSKIEGGQELAEAIFEELKSNGIEATKSTYKSMMTLFGTPHGSAGHINLTSESSPVHRRSEGNINNSRTNCHQLHCDTRNVQPNTNGVRERPKASGNFLSANYIPGTNTNSPSGRHSVPHASNSTGDMRHALAGEFQKDSRNPRLLLQEMWERGMRPDVKTYNAALFTCARVAQLGLAQEIFTDMKMAGVQPDVQSYNALISACAKVSALDRAEQYFAEMLERRFVPETITYNGLISAAGRSNDCVKAEKFFQCMKNAGLEPDCASFNALLAAVAKNSLERSEQLLVEMLNRNIQLTLVSHTTLISAASKSRTPERAEDFFRMLLVSGLRPNAVTYTSMISAAVQYSNERAFELYREMTKMGLEPTNKIFKTLLEAAVEAYNDCDNDRTAELISRNAEMLIRHMQKVCTEMERHFKVILLETFSRHWNVTNLLSSEASSSKFSSPCTLPLCEVYPRTPTGNSYYRWEPQVYKKRESRHDGWYAKKN